MAVSGIWLGILLIGFCRVTISSEPYLVSRSNNVCGTWIPYQDTKCVKVIETPLHDKESAALLCQSYSDDYSILRIQSENEQAFFSQLLFVEEDIEDNIWLEFEFTTIKPDLNRRNVTSHVLNVPVHYNNFKTGTDHLEEHGQCVQMLPPTKETAAGLWEKVSCNKRNVVVCERPQAQTTEDMLRVLMKRQVNVNCNTGCSIGKMDGHQIKEPIVCPATFTRIYDKCYYFSNYLAKFDAARRACHNLNPSSELLVIDTKEEWRTIHDYMTTHKKLFDKHWWMGGSDRNEEGIWTWVKNGEQLMFNEWCSGEPSGGNENCLHLWSRKVCYNDRNCEASINFVCEPTLQ